MTVDGEATPRGATVEGGAGTTPAVRHPQPVVAQVPRLTGVAPLLGLSPS